MIMSIKQRKLKIEPRIKLNHNTYTDRDLSNINQKTYVIITYYLSSQGERASEIVLKTKENVCFFYQS